MPIVKRQAPSHFTTLPNEMLADRRLSWEARGMLAFLLSASGDYNIATLEGVGDCGRERTMRILTELRDGGYLHLLQKNERGESSYCVTDAPADAVELEPPITAPPLKDRTKRRGIATRLPDDWKAAPDLVDAILVKYPTLNMQEEEDAFKDYWQARGSTFVDWSAAFRNWCRLAASRVKSTDPKTKSALIHEENHQRARRALDRLAGTKTFANGHLLEIRSDGDDPAP